MQNQILFLAFSDELEKLAKKLTTEERNNLTSSQFALAGRKYPIEDRAHARNALSRVSAHGTPAEKKIVRRKVHARYPGIGK